MTKALRAFVLITVLVLLVLVMVTPSFADAASDGCATLDGYTDLVGNGQSFGPYSLVAGEVVVLTVSNIAGPANSTVIISATVNNIPITATVLAEAGDVVVTIPFDVSAAFALSGTFNSANVAVSCTNPDDVPTAVNDGVGNSEAVLFTSSDGLGINLYGINSDGDGYYVFSITEDDVAAYADNPPAVNTLIKQSDDGYFSLYVLTTGEFQINIGPDEEGKTYVIIFDGLSPNNVYGYTIES